MSPPPLGVEEKGGSNVSLLTASGSMESMCQTSPELKERNYMGLSDCSSVDSSVASPGSAESRACLNLKATELRLGLPGSQSPERSPEPCMLNSGKLDEKPLFPLHPFADSHCTSSPKIVISGNKRGFSDAMGGFSEGKFLGNSEANVMLSPRPSVLKSGSILDNVGPQPVKAKEAATPKVLPDKPHAATDSRVNHSAAANNTTTGPAMKAQVVGWPPIRSFRKKNSLATSKNTDEVDGKAGFGPLFVKVSMDGAPYLRKVDLKNYSKYQDLSSALEKMFSCFTIGQYGSHGSGGKEHLSESKLKDMLHGSEYVLTYEDKDGDWMLVGDVPWEMFIETCKRLRIMKGSDAIGLAPRAMEKSRSRN